MANRIKSANYYAYLARVQDEQAVNRFCDNLPENFFAVLISNNSNFAGLVLPSEECGAAAATDELAISHSEVLEHPLTRESDTRIGALTASYQAYMGALVIERIREVS